MIRRSNHPKLPPPVAPFSHVVVDGDYAHLSGLLAADLPDGARVIGDVAGETRLVMAAIGELLATVSLTMSDVVRVQVHLADLDDAPTMNRAYAGFFPEGALPARTCTESPKLHGGCRVEITVTARRRETHRRRDR
ncbi:MAG: RidA family protein [Pseudomonadota bacterium]